MGVERAPGVSFLGADYLILTSRLIPGLDGGYFVATVARARQLAAAGANNGLGPLLLSVDPASASEHAAHRQQIADRGDPRVAARMRNLFDEAADPAGGAAGWLRAAARPGEADPNVQYRTIRDAAGRPVLDLPVITGDPHWFASIAPVVARDPSGRVSGILDGFGALYLAWLRHVLAEIRTDRPGPVRPAVLICESRQLGELLVGWDDPDVRVLQAVHSTHLDPPYTADAPLNALTARWLPSAARMDAVLWLTRSQRDDVVARFGDPDLHRVAPNGVILPARVPPRSAPVSPRAIMLARLTPVKRIDHAIRALAVARQRVPAATLDIFGDGPERGRLEQLINELSLTAAVTLRGVTDDTEAAIDAASAVLCTSAYEGQSLALVEGAARGCPAVSYDVNYGPRDLLGAGGGILVPEGDYVSLGEALAGLWQDPDAWSRLSQEAIVAARQSSEHEAITALAAAAVATLSRPSRRVR